MTLLLFVGFRIEKYVRASNPCDGLALETNLLSMRILINFLIVYKI